MEEKRLENIPYIAHEAEVMRHEQDKKKLWIAVLVSVVLLFASNMIWLYAWMSYDYVSTVTVDGKEGVANYLGGNGDINNGKDYVDKIADTQGNTGNKEP